jgi:multiple sugar transport system permease protein
MTPITSSSSSSSDLVRSGLRYAVFAIFLLYCILPATWILAAMAKDNSQIFTTFGLWFAYPIHLFENIAGLFAYRDGIFVQWFGNSLIYAVSISVASTMTCALGGYAFAKYDFPGKKFLFNFIIATVTVPSTALVLPLFLMLNKLGLLNTMWGVILPSLVNPFGLYLMPIFW